MSTLVVARLVGRDLGVLHSPEVLATVCLHDDDVGPFDVQPGVVVEVEDVYTGTLDDTKLCHHCSQRAASAVDFVHLSRQRMEMQMSTSKCILSLLSVS